MVDPGAARLSSRPSLPLSAPQSITVQEPRWLWHYPVAAAPLVTCCTRRVLHDAADCASTTAQQSVAFQSARCKAESHIYLLYKWADTAFFVCTACKPKRRYLLTGKVSRYCLLACTTAEISFRTSCCTWTQSYWAVDPLLQAVLLRCVMLSISDCFWSLLPAGT